jgi:regulatory protein
VRRQQAEPQVVEQGAMKMVVEQGAMKMVVEQGAKRPISRDPARRDPASRDPEPDDERDLGPEADPESVARKILLDQLTGRARSRADLEKKLAQRKVPAEIATRLLDRFEEVGLVDDAAFAREWVSQRQEGRGLARRALAQELRRKGIDDEVAREALGAVDLDDEVEAARLLVRRKLRSVRGLETDKAVRRLVGMLARKGHASSVAYRVVREELAVDLADPEHLG